MVAQPTDSILKTIRQMINGNADDTAFDTDLIVFINGSLMILNQLGVGPPGYSITSDLNTWGEFLGDRDDLELVKTAVYLRVRLAFDPPTNSFVVDALIEQRKEAEWYIGINSKVTPQEVVTP